MDRGYESHADAGARGKPLDGRTYDTSGMWFAVAFLLLLGIVVPAYLLDQTPERRARHEQQKSENLRRTTARLRDQAVAILPPDATEVTVTRDDWPVGWLTFVRVEGGKAVKFLVCYRYDQATAEVSLSIARAD